MPCGNFYLTSNDSDVTHFSCQNACRYHKIDMHLEQHNPILLQEFETVDKIFAVQMKNKSSLRACRHANAMIFLFCFCCLFKMIEFQ